jgi:AmmeMemoRadiSam system protein A
MEEGHRNGGFEIDAPDRDRLLRIARTSITSVVRGEPVPDFDVTSENLREKCGAFVTLEIESRLRGCIGSIESDRPLFRVVSEMAVASAMRDPRFPPLSEGELDRVAIEISVLSPLRKIDRIEEIEVGKHGLLVRQGFNSGLLLPQVASRYGWTREQFLRETCRKAALPRDAWQSSDCEVQIFSAVVFGEAEHD